MRISPTLHNRFSEKETRRFNIISHSCKVLRSHINHFIHPVANFALKEPWPSYSEHSTVFQQGFNKSDCMIHISF